MNNIIVFKKGHMKRITKERMTEIERITANILSERHVDFWKDPYIDIVSIVKQDGFNVVPVSMPIDTTGCLLVSDNPLEYKRLIIVNKDFKNPENEKDIVFKESRFITAHEYGHYMLHKASLEDTKTWYMENICEKIQKEDIEAASKQLAEFQSICQYYSEHGKDCQTQKGNEKENGKE